MRDIFHALRIAHQASYAMEILRIIVLALLTMAGYSSGVTLAAREREFLPRILDLLVAALLWLALFWLRPQMGRWAVLGAAVLLSLVVGYLLTAARMRHVDDTAVIPKSELPEHAREKGDTAVSGGIFKRGWRRWNHFAGKMGNVQGRLLMGYFYFIVVAPFGVIARLFSDPLNIKKRPEQSEWHPKEPTDLTIQGAREQG